MLARGVVRHSLIHEECAWIFPIGSGDEFTRRRHSEAVALDRDVRSVHRRSEADARGVRGPKNSNVTAAVSPIVSLTRGAAIQPVPGLNYFVRPVIGIDPRAANDAVNSVGTAPNDGFYTPVNFRGAFSPTENWLCDWSAADAFGFTSPAANECPAESNCPADLNGDGSVGGSDLATLLASWGSAGGDVDGNGTTDGADLGALLASWGSCG